MRKRTMRILMTAMAVTLSIGVLAGCGSSNATGDKSQENVTIAISGSTSVGPLMEHEAEVYMEANKNVEIEIQQIGSSAGIKNAISGVSEIGMASRELKDKEKSEISETVIAYDGIALVTKGDKGIDSLSLEQIKDIYTGKVTNWSELGGVDAPIVVVSREDGSGTRDAFQELVGFKAEELLETATIADKNGVVKTTVQGNENAIGYISFEYLDDSLTAIKCDGVEPTAENVISKEYKLSRPFLVVYKEDKLTEEGQKFIDYILSEEGQKIVEENGSIKLK